MKAYFLVKNGASDKAFELRETAIPEPNPNQVQIKVETFGLNFADVMARKNLHLEAPPKPAILGYDVVGTITKMGVEVDGLSVGQRVMALTRFGGYAEYVSTDYLGVVPIGDDMPAADGVSLATQAGTAVFMMEEMVKVHTGDQVLIHSAAGGVGSILVQMARARGCVIFATAGSDQKIEFLKSQGVHHAINYQKEDFEEAIKAIMAKYDRQGLDVIFDAVAGTSIRKGIRLLDAGGRMVIYGAAAFTSAGNIFSKIRTLIGFGIYHPLALMTPSKSIICVNMLKIGDNRPDMLNRVLRRAIELYNQKIIKPLITKEYPHTELARAHEALGDRKTSGKIAMHWD